MTFEGLSLAGMATMTPKDFLLHLHKAGYRIVRNVARGITPTAEGWDTPPSNLENATDGDLTTSTGEGEIITSGADSRTELCTISFGSPKTGLVMVDMEGKTDAGTVYWYLRQKIEGTWHEPMYSMVDFRDNIYRRKVALVSSFFTATDITLHCYISTAATVNAKIYEIIALEVIP